MTRGGNNAAAGVGTMQPRSLGVTTTLALHRRDAARRVLDWQRLAVWGAVIAAPWTVLVLLFQLFLSG
jgi:hypothetical protein